MVIPERHKKLIEERDNHAGLRQLKGDAQAGVDFFSNDYLGLVHCCAVEVVSGRVGSTGSRLLSGDSTLALEVEQNLATFFNSEAALLYQSGYMANLGLLSCVAGRTDTIIYDELVHASIRQGIQLSNSRSFSFKHNDCSDLEIKLQQSSGQCYVVIESLYSMDGDWAELERIVHLCEAYQALLIVDEAHSTGVIGAHGRGFCQYKGLEEKVWARIYTFGKAAGMHGAIVVGDKALKTFLVNFSKPFIYTTAMADKDLHLINQIPSLFEKNEYRDQLHENIAFFNAEVHRLGLGLFFSRNNSPIQIFMPENGSDLLGLADHLQGVGFQVKAIRYPTVPKGLDRIRICIHSFNTVEQITVLLHHIKELIHS